MITKARCIQTRRAGRGRADQGMTPPRAELLEGSEVDDPKELKNQETANRAQGNQTESEI